jgi:membrane-bound serine protease (ClpP class)
MLAERAQQFLFIFFLCFILTAIFAPLAAAGPDDKVLVLEISEAITPNSDDIVTDATEKAENENFEALVISLDTPGGELDETQVIIRTIENASVSIIGYVLENGKTWSAGILVLMGMVDVAAMAYFTVIGSAQPIQMSAEGAKTHRRRENNKCPCQAIATAIKHGRNETFAEEA